MNFTFLSYLQNYKEFEAEILDLQLEKYWYQKNVLLPVEPWGWEYNQHKVFWVQNYSNRKSIEVQPCTPLEIMLNRFCLQIIR